MGAVRVRAGQGARGLAAPGGAGVLALAGTVLLAGCAAAPVPRGAPVGIVSLNPCSDAVLAEVADPQQIRGLSAYSSDPASSSMDVALARRFPAVSGTVEEIAALRPAVVVSSTFTPPATRAALARLGIPLVELPIASDVPESLAQVRVLARVAGHPERGEALVRRIAAALAAARPADARRIPALVWQSGGIVPGDRSLIADLLRRTGFANAAAARGLGQADYLPLERLLADPPELILTAGGRGGESGGESGDESGDETGDGGGGRLLNHPALRQLTATRRARLESALLWCGGPTIIRTAARLAAVRRAMGGEPPRTAPPPLRRQERDPAAPGQPS